MVDNDIQYSNSQVMNTGYQPYMNPNAAAFAPMGNNGAIFNDNQNQSNTTRNNSYQAPQAISSNDFFPHNRPLN